MTTYLLRFTPGESYIFADERSFAFPSRSHPGQMSGRYSIAGEDIPSQTTLFGALRYLLLPCRRADRTAYTPEERALAAQAVGEDSFDIDAGTVQTFGAIRAMSPVFLLHGEERLVPVPGDHVTGQPVYTPFDNYQRVMTPTGERLYTAAYDPKRGVSDALMSVDTGEVTEREAVFAVSTQWGHRQVDSDIQLYKKDRTILQAGYAFGVYVTLEDTLIPRDGLVLMGQGGCPFHAAFIPQANTLAEAVRARLPRGTVYCLGDTFAFDGMREETLFAVTRTRTYRSLRTAWGQVTRCSVLHQVLRAGSVFIPRDIPAFLRRAQDNENRRQIGFNTLVSREEAEQ